MALPRSGEWIRGHAGGAQTYRTGYGGANYAVIAANRAGTSSARALTTSRVLWVTARDFSSDEPLVSLSKQPITQSPSTVASREALVAILQSALAFLSKGDLERAENECREVLRRVPEHGDAAYLLGRVLERAGRLDEAVEFLRRALATDPAHAPYHTSLGEALSAIGDATGAIQALGEAVRLAPGDPRPRNSLGIALLNAGRMKEAEARFVEVMETDPTWPGACLNLSRVRQFGPGDHALLERIRGVLAHTDLPDEALSDVHFALGKVHDDLGQAQIAFEHYRRANELIRARVRFDAVRHAASVDATIESFTAALFARHREIGVPSERPVLIVGMPRSGTTLVEQILAAHPRVHAGGELPYLDELSRRLASMLGTKERYPRCVSQVRGDCVSVLATEYLQRVGKDAGEALRCTDKMPANFMHLGFAALLLPRARVMHCRRDPIDTGFSIYTNQFASGHEWAYDLNDIADFYRQYQRVMNHWEQVLPLEVMEVHYEALVERPEEVSRELVDFCGLPWDDACLEFYRLRRNVATASNWQVRQPIYQRSVGRWRRYERDLRPLRDALEQPASS